MRLASRRSPPARATRLIGRTEGADEVVRELEGQPQVAARALEGRDDLEDAPARTAPAHRGARERVDGGLVVGGREQGIRIRAVARDSVLDIRELAGRRDEDGVVEESEERFPLRGADLGECDQSHGLMQQEIAGEDRSGVAEQRLSGGVGALRSCPQPELTADVRDAAADRVVVDDVVVHDERGVEKLERRGDGVEGGLGCGVAVARLEGGGDQRGAESLPAGGGAGDRIAECAREAPCAGAGLDAPDGVVDRMVDRRGGGRRECDHDARRRSCGEVRSNR